MRTDSLCAMVWILPVALSAGCLAPVVELNHYIPGAVPVPADTRNILVDRFEHHGHHAAGETDFLQTVLREKISQIFPHYPQTHQHAIADNPFDNVLKITGSLTITAQDQRSTRTIRLWNPDSKLPEPREVRSLVRRISVAVAFTLSRADTGREIVTAETLRRYDSVADPRARGHLALERPDDPELVPDADTVIKELLAECVDDFGRMIRPAAIYARHRLKDGRGPLAAEALRAARTGDLQTAQNLFAEAIKADPTDRNILFNLAVLSEANGRYERAYRYYEQLCRQTGDSRLQEDLKRLRQVILNQPEQPPFTQPPGFAGNH